MQPTLRADLLESENMPNRALVFRIENRASPTINGRIPIGTLYLGIINIGPNSIVRKIGVGFDRDKRIYVG